MSANAVVEGHWMAEGVLLLGVASEQSPPRATLQGQWGVEEAKEEGSSPDVEVEKFCFCGVRWSCDCLVPRRRYRGYRWREECRDGGRSRSCTDVMGLRE